MLVPSVGTGVQITPNRTTTIQMQNVTRLKYNTSQTMDGNAYRSIERPCDQCVCCLLLNAIRPTGTEKTEVEDSRLRH